jgi:hypothetical protein
MRAMPVITLFVCCCLSVSPAFGDYGDCGQPVSDDEQPTASDAREILVYAVGLPSECDVLPCICDVNYAGEPETNVTALDALIDLKRAVGEDVILTCCPEAP